MLFPDQAKYHFEKVKGKALIIDGTRWLPLQTMTHGAQLYTVWARKGWTQDKGQEELNYIPVRIISENVGGYYRLETLTEADKEAMNEM